METKKLIGAAAFSLALAGGGIAGSLLGAPGTSGAQETTTTTDSDTESSDGGEVHHHRFGGPGIEAAAEALGLTEDELRAELEAGKTIADVAAARNVDVETVIDAMVAAATADLREHVTAIVNGEAPVGGPGRGHHRGGPGFGARLDTVAEALGITEDELHDAIQDGQTIAEVAEANGVDVQAVIDALVAEASARIDEKVADGDLTQEEADDLKAEVTDRITEMVNNGGGFRGGRGFGGGPRP